MKLNSVETKVIDRAEAERMLVTYHYERQRKINKGYVDHFARLMKRDEWLPGTEMALAWVSNGSPYLVGKLVNGQHRLHAVIQADAEIDVVVKHFDCADDNEVAHLYGTIDTGRSRNVDDYLRAVGMEQEFGFTHSDNNCLGRAVAFMSYGFRPPSRTSMTLEERAEAMRRYSAAAAIYLEIIAGVNKVARGKMRTAPVMAVALVTLDEASNVYGEEKVERFWSGTAHNDGLHIGDPRKLANEHLMQASYTSRDKYRKTSSTYTARYIAACFNAWVEDRSIKQTRVEDALSPMRISGTRYKG